MEIVHAPSLSGLAADETNDLSEALDAWDAFNTKWEGILAERRAGEDPRINTLRAHVAILTAERDDARAGRRLLSDQANDNAALILELQAERDALKVELEGVADWINRHVPAGTPGATAKLTRLRYLTGDRT